MCERVRTRNTLHEVGARKSSICYNAVEGREKMNNKKKEKIVKYDKCRKERNMKILVFYKIL